MKVIIIVIDGQVIDNSLLLLYYTALFSFEYSHQLGYATNLKYIYLFNNLSVQARDYIIT